jgi:hypothetical protein
MHTHEPHLLQISRAVFFRGIQFGHPEVRAKEARRSSMATAWRLIAMSLLPAV